MLNGPGFIDLRESLKNLFLPLYLSRADIRQRYRRSTLGPFWITISTGVMIGSLGVIFGSLFKAPISEFLPFLAAGLIIWNLISSCITDATYCFCNSEQIIKQLPIPLFVHILRMVSRNFYIFLHNILIIPLVLLFVQRPIGFTTLLFIPGTLIVIINLLWISLILGVICARFRDLTQIVASVLQIVFYVTPIIWMPSLLPKRTAVMLLDPNPFYHLIEIMRAPLMNSFPTTMNWVISLLTAIVGWIFAIMIFNKYRDRVAYWL